MKPARRCRARQISKTVFSRSILSIRVLFFHCRRPPCFLLPLPLRALCSTANSLFLAFSGPTGRQRLCMREHPFHNSPCRKTLQVVFPVRIVSDNSIKAMILCNNIQRFPEDRPDRFLSAWENRKTGSEIWSGKKPFRKMKEPAIKQAIRRGIQKRFSSFSKSFVSPASGCPYAKIEDKKRHAEENPSSLPARCAHACRTEPPACAFSVFTPVDQDRILPSF